MTIIRQRLPESVFDKVFVFVLSLLEQKGLFGFGERSYRGDDRDLRRQIRSPERRRR